MRTPYSTVAVLSAPGEGQQQVAPPGRFIIGFWRPFYRSLRCIYADPISTEHFEGFHKNRSLPFRMAVLMGIWLKTSASFSCFQRLPQNERASELIIYFPQG